MGVKDLEAGESKQQIIVTPQAAMSQLARIMKVSHKSFEEEDICFTTRADVHSNGRI